MTHCRYFYSTRKGNHSATLTPIVDGGRRPLPSEVCVQSDPPPFEKRRLRPISAHNVSSVGDIKNSSITTNIKSTTGFPTSHRWSAYVTPKCLKRVAQRVIFCFYHASICEGGLGSRNSVRPSVCLSHASIVTKLNDALQIGLF